MSTKSQDNAPGRRSELSVVMDPTRVTAPVDNIITTRAEAEEWLRAIGETLVAKNTNLSGHAILRALEILTNKQRPSERKRAHRTAPTPKV